MRFHLLPYRPMERLVPESRSYTWETWGNLRSHPAPVVPASLAQLIAITIMIKMTTKKRRLPVIRTLRMSMIMETFRSLTCRRQEEDKSLLVAAPRRADCALPLRPVHWTPTSQQSIGSPLPQSVGQIGDGRKLVCSDNARGDPIFQVPMATSCP